MRQSSQQAGVSSEEIPLEVVSFFRRHRVTFEKQQWIVLKPWREWEVISRERRLSLLERAGDSGWFPLYVIYKMTYLTRS
jgi:hypothetical protein